MSGKVDKAKPLSTEEFNIRTGTLLAHDRAYIVAGHKILESSQEAHSFLFEWKGANNWSHVATRWGSGSICFATQPTEHTIMLGESGQTVSIDADRKVTVGKVVERGTVTSINSVNGYAYVVGMSGLALRQTEANQWAPVELGLPKSVSLEAIAGRNENNLCAVGWKGEIVVFSDGIASRVTAPSNVILTSVCVGPNEDYFCCGQNGVLLQGRGNLFRALPHGIRNDFWSVKWFQGELYVASIHCLYVYDRKQKDLKRVDMGEATSISAYHLSTFNDQYMLSIGRMDISLFDGKTWHQVL